MLTKGDLDQQAIQRELLKKQSIDYNTVDVYCDIPNESIVEFITLMYLKRIEGWWLYNEELIDSGVCTVEQYRESLKQDLGR